MNPKQLETYSFWWSEVRLVVAALALLIGGVPPILLIAPSSMYAFTALGLKLAWIVSGLASAYLLYRWYHNGQRVFGGKDHQDTLAFLVMTISGINLGLAGIFGKNLGMNIMSGKIVFLIVGLIYLYVAYHLYTRWNKHNKLF
jgi:uncharacterized membrane protein YuzA (DUF378 family)